MKLNSDNLSKKIQDMDMENYKNKPRYYTDNQGNKVEVSRNTVLNARRGAYVQDAEEIDTNPMVVLKRDLETAKISLTRDVMQKTAQLQYIDKNMPLVDSKIANHYYGQYENATNLSELNEREELQKAAWQGVKDVASPKGLKMILAMIAVSMMLYSAYGYVTSKKADKALNEVVAAEQMQEVNSPKM